MINNDIASKKGFSIAHVIESCLGGTSTYLSTIIDYQQKNEYVKNIYLIACERKITQMLSETTKQIYYYRSSRNPLKFFLVSKKLISYINYLKPDIVHLHGSFPGVYVRLFNIFLKYRPIIMYCAHGWSFCQDISSWQNFIYARVEKFLSSRCNAIINISQDEFTSARKYGVISKDNFMLYNGVRDTIISANKNLFIVDNEKIKLLFVGRFDKQKGLDIIIDLFNKEDFPEIEIFAIGTNDRSRKKLHLGEKIKYIGWINPCEIDDYYKLVDAVIIPSRWEGFGLVTIEAMRNSKPIIASNRGGLPEIVIDGFNGFIFKFEDIKSLSIILKSLDKQKLFQMGINGRKLYEERYTVENFNNNLMAIYFKLLQYNS